MMCIFLLLPLCFCGTNVDNCMILSMYVYMCMFIVYTGLHILHCMRLIETLSFTVYIKPWNMKMIPPSEKLNVCESHSVFFI